MRVGCVPDSHTLCDYQKSPAPQGAAIQYTALNALSQGAIPGRETSARRPPHEASAKGFPTLAQQLAPPHRTLRLASILLFAQGLALIPLFLAASKRDLDLGVRAEKVDR